MQNRLTVTIAGQKFSLVADEPEAYMKEIAAQYPQYEFDRHKGYGTKRHYELLRQYGPSPIHRRTFLKNL